jgi:hypothetical protein
MVPGLYPNDLLKQAFKSDPFHWQNDFDKDPNPSFRYGCLFGANFD